MTNPGSTAPGEGVTKLVARLRGLLSKATPAPWRHYDKVFRPQFGQGRVTEVQRADGKPIVSWSGFDGLPPVTARKKNANAALMVAAVNALPTLFDALENQRTPSLPIGGETSGEVERARQIIATGLGLDNGNPIDEAAALICAQSVVAALRSNTGAASDGERIAREELAALAALIERPPLDDVLLEQDVAMRAAAAIRTILALSPAPNAEERVLREAARAAHDTLIEINPNNYSHDDVVEANDAAVEAILLLADALGETHGKSREWWQERRSALSAPPAQSSTAVVSGGVELRDAVGPIIERAGGWFVTGDDWSGPWATEEAAQYASDGEYGFAHDAHRAALNQEPTA